MMEIAVMISIHPYWCGNIANLLKLLEIRKSIPKILTPFKCYIYCTKDNKQMFWKSRTYTYVDDRSHNGFDICGNGKVIGEFMCDKIHEYEWSAYEYPNDRNGEYLISDEDLKCTCLSYQQFSDYGNQRTLYGLRITELKIYDTPKELRQFKGCHRCNLSQSCERNRIACGGAYTLTRPPQSWCYVREV